MAYKGTVFLDKIAEISSVLQVELLRVLQEKNIPTHYLLFVTDEVISLFSLLGMIARNTAADVSVIALIGERGRELKDFIERNLGPEGLARSGVIFSTMSGTKVTPLLNEMDDRNVARILRAMKNNLVANIIPKLEPRKAVRVSRILGRIDETP